MKKLSFLLALLLVPLLGYSQSPLIKSLDLSSTRSSAFQVFVDSSYVDSTGQTVDHTFVYSRHLHEYTAAEGLIRARLEYPDRASWVERTQRLELETELVYNEVDTVYMESPPDTVYAYQEKTVYATEIPDDTAMYYDVHESLRDIEWQVIEDSTNADLFRIRVFGTTTADRISFASKCIGHDADMNLITQTEAIHLTPDAEGKVEGETPDYMCHPEGGNAAMNTWLTARFDNQEDVLVIGYIDIAHIRGLSQ